MRFCIWNLNFFKIISVGCKHIFSYPYQSSQGFCHTSLDTSSHAKSHAYSLYYTPFAKDDYGHFLFDGSRPFGGNRLFLIFKNPYLVFILTFHIVVVLPRFVTCYYRIKMIIHRRTCWAFLTPFIYYDTPFERLLTDAI